MRERTSRYVDNNMLTSETQPAIKLRVDPALEYVGRLNFTIYDVADAEVFLFAEAEEPRRLKRWLIVQFESYLPDNSHTYDYPEEGLTQLGSHDYITDYYAFAPGQLFANSAPDSDVAHTYGLLHEKGYVLPSEAVRVRFVRLLDEARRSEVLLIYTEDLALQGPEAGGAGLSGPLGAEYSYLTGGLLRRALAAFSIEED